MRKRLIITSSLLAVALCSQSVWAGSVIIRAAELDSRALSSTQADRGRVLTFAPPAALNGATIVYATLEFELDSLSVDRWDGLSSRIVEIRPLRTAHGTDAEPDYMPTRHVSVVFDKEDTQIRVDITGLARAMQATSSSQWQLAIGLLSESVDGRCALKARNGDAARLVVQYR